jgi:hypothetical protein
MAAASTLAQLALPDKAPPKSASTTPAASAASAPPQEQDVGTQTDEHARTLGLSKDFDSLSATARLAAETGVLGAFASFINTASGSASTAASASEPPAPPPQPETAPAAVASLASATQQSIAAAWSPAHRLVFGASVTIAIVAAAVIIFV